MFGFEIWFGSEIRYKTLFWDFWFVLVRFSSVRSGLGWVGFDLGWVRLGLVGLGLILDLGLGLG